MSESTLEHARVMAYPPTPCTYSAHEWRKVVQELLAELESARLDTERLYEWSDALSRYNETGKVDAMMAVVTEMINFSTRRAAIEQEQK